MRLETLAKFFPLPGFFRNGSSQFWRVSFSSIPERRNYKQHDLSNHLTCSTANILLLLKILLEFWSLFVYMPNLYSKWLIHSVFGFLLEGKKHGVEESCIFQANDEKSRLEKPLHYLFIQMLMM